MNFLEIEQDIMNKFDAFYKEGLDDDELSHLLTCMITQYGPCDISIDNAISGIPTHILKGYSEKYDASPMVVIESVIHDYLHSRLYGYIEAKYIKKDAHESPIEDLSPEEDLIGRQQSAQTTVKRKILTVEEAMSSYKPYS